MSHHALQRLALWSAVFFIVNWVLGCAFLLKPYELIDKIFYFGVAPALTLPIICMVMYDFPRDRPNTYQVVLCLSTWSWRAGLHIPHIYLRLTFDNRSFCTVLNM